VGEVGLAVLIEKPQGLLGRVAKVNPTPGGFSEVEPSLGTSREQALTPLDRERFAGERGRPLGRGVRAFASM
jgi:hypothetical protein